MNSFTHSIMFHHFYDEKIHPKGQGAISSTQFQFIIDYLNEKYNLLKASEYLEKFLNAKLDDLDVCLSFDDALKCQYDIAIPVLNKNNLDAFFFVYTSPISGRPDFLEVYRYFRTVKYKNIDEFYREFFEVLKSRDAKFFLNSLEEFEESEFLSEFIFYTENDRFFRYLRDHPLSKEEYHSIMIELFRMRSFDFNSVLSLLWMTSNEIKDLSKLGNIIGLHSHNHPTQIHKLKKKDQINEYETNLKYLKNLSEKKIISMSHPCGNYSSETLDILNEMGIKIGFRSNFSIKNINSPLEIPREDHSNILKEISK